MLTGIRTQGLRKIYAAQAPSAPGGFAFAARKKTKKQPDVVALEDLSLEVAPGEIFGLLGPNRTETGVRLAICDSLSVDPVVLSNDIADSRLESQNRKPDSIS